MKLKSGREVSNELMNGLSEDATLSAFGNESVHEGLDAVTDSLRDGFYEGLEQITEDEINEIIEKLSPVVGEACDKLREFYNALVKTHIMKDNW